MRQALALAGLATLAAVAVPAAAAPAANGFGLGVAGGDDFNVNLGDTIYSDSEVPGSLSALTVAQRRLKYRLGLALPALRTLRASAGLYSQWDDHLRAVYPADRRP